MKIRCCRFTKCTWQDIVLRCSRHFSPCTGASRVGRIDPPGENDRTVPIENTLRYSRRKFLLATRGKHLKWSIVLSDGDEPAYNDNCLNERVSFSRNDLPITHPDVDFVHRHFFNQLRCDTKHPQFVILTYTFLRTRLCA